MKALVTGGAGFIGSHLVDQLLHQRHNVIVLDNFSTGRYENLSNVMNDIDVIECDVKDDGKWQEKFSGVDWVFHLAAMADIVPSIERPKEYYDTNVTGTLRVLEACKDAKISNVVYAASSSCYGIPDEYPTREGADIRPQYPYALTKYLGEELVLHWGQVYDLPVTSLRLFNVYGPRARTRGAYGAVMGVFLAQKLARVPLTVVGSGDQTRDFTFVSDVVSALIKAAEKEGTGEIYNVGSGRTVSINRVVELLESEKETIPERPGEPSCTFAHIMKIKRDLGWNPVVTIEDGMSELVERISDWSDAPVWTADTIGFATKEWFRYLK